VSPDERAQARADELEMLIIREALSFVAMGLVLVLLSPGLRMWVQQKVWQVRKIRARGQDHEDAMVALLRRELSRDLPLVERGEVAP
jgi:predicted metallopeptidase